jgi:hypothetical protein
MPSHHRSHPGSGSGQAKYPGTFLLAFQEALAGLHWQVRRWLGGAVVCLNEAGQEHVVGLENLYRRARVVERTEWPALITSFLRTVSSVEGESNLPQELAAASDQLLPRLGPPLKISDDTRVWFQPLDGTNMGITLVVDYPDRMCYVTEQLVTDSGRPGIDWVEIALANLRGRTPDDCFQIVDKESGLMMCGLADAYDTSRSLLLDQLLPESRALGCLLALPGRDELLVLPVSKPALAYVHLLKILSQKNYKTAPYPISDEVFWVHHGVWRELPIHIGSKEITIQPPQEFIDLLAQSPREETDPEQSGHN